jgi:hypothetical protein
MSEPSPLPVRLPAPGPSFVREHDVRVRDLRLRAGMSRPTDAPDDWWLAVLWVADDDGIVSFRDVAPAAGPPPEPPLARLGPSLAGGLAGLVREEDGRIAIRLTPVVAPADPARPWVCPLAVRSAFKWEPVRQAVMRPNELADTVLAAFRRAVEGLSRPSG